MFCAIISFLINIFISFIFRIGIYGIENIPDNTGAILCANHLSNFDPIILRIKIKREIDFMAKKELFNNKFLAYTLKKFGAIPVDRNKNDLESYKSAIKILENKKILGIFIQGTRNKNKNKNIDFDGAKNGAAMFALKTNLPVIPVTIQANYKLFSLVKINIGKPIYFPESKKITRDILSQTTSIIIKKIQDLK